MGRTTRPWDAMSGAGTSGFTDLCIVAAVDVEFKIAANLLSRKSFSEEPHMKICRGLFGARRVTILQSGMGAISFAERFAEHFAKNSSTNSRPLSPSSSTRLRRNPRIATNRSGLSI